MISKALDINAKVIATTMLGGVRDGKQVGISVLNVYLPQADPKHNKERDDLCDMIKDWIEEMKRKDYMILIMGDLNFAMEEGDRHNGKINTGDEYIRPKVEGWGLNDIWTMRRAMRIKETGIKTKWAEGHTHHRKGDKEKKIQSQSSRIDYALCCDVLMIRPQASIA